MNAKFLRVSDIVNALFFSKNTTAKPFQKHYDRADLMHEAIKRWQDTELSQQLYQRLRFVTRRTGNIFITGSPDAVRVLKSKDGLKVAVVEYKTSQSGELSEKREKAAIFQLQLYIWLIKPAIEAMGLELNKRHYVEFIDLHRPIVKRRIPVQEKEDIEVTIWNIVHQYFEGD